MIAERVADNKNRETRVQKVWLDDVILKMEEVNMSQELLATWKDKSGSIDSAKQ